MVAEPLDRHVIDWALGSGASFYYVYEEGLPQPCLKVHSGHVTGYFHRGRLVRVWAFADDAFFCDMLDEFTALRNLSDRHGPHPLCPPNGGVNIRETPIPAAIVSRLTPS